MATGRDSASNSSSRSAISRYSVLIADSAADHVDHADTDTGAAAATADSFAASAADSADLVAAHLADFTADLITDFCDAAAIDADADTDTFHAVNSADSHAANHAQSADDRSCRSRTAWIAARADAFTAGWISSPDTRS